MKTLLIALVALMFCVRVNADLLAFGSAESEQSHALVADHSDVITGLLSQSARRLLPLESPTWNGGTVSFTMKIDPEQQNFFTARFSGDDVNENRLVL